MPLVCEECGHVAGRVMYDPPTHAGRDVKVFLGLVVASALLGIYNLTVVLFEILPIVDKAADLGASGIEIPSSRLALLHDVVQLYNNSTRYFLTVMMLALVFVPARALHLVILSLGGHPLALPRLRGILVAQFGVELFTTSSLLALGFKLQVIDIPSRFGYNLIVAPIAFAVSLRAAVKTHFSSFRVERVPIVRAPSAI